MDLWNSEAHCASIAAERALIYGPSRQLIRLDVRSALIYGPYSHSIGLSVDLVLNNVASISMRRDAGPLADSQARHTIRQWEL